MAGHKKRPKSNWPVVMVVKIERHLQVQWANIPSKRVEVNGFRVHFLSNKKGKPRIEKLRFDRGKWIFKSFPGVK